MGLGWEVAVAEGGAPLQPSLMGGATVKVLAGNGDRIQEVPFPSPPALPSTEGHLLDFMWKGKDRGACLFCVGKRRSSLYLHLQRMLLNSEK